VKLFGSSRESLRTDGEALPTVREALRTVGEALRTGGSCLRTTRSQERVDFLYLWVRDAKILADLAGEKVVDLPVARYGAPVSQLEVAPPGMAGTLTEEDAIVGGKMRQ
jgi:hypothetical protein